jgi:flagellum-specific ATP synthase
LVEGDDLQDPIADLARASLDGHVVLSRQMADAGVYPAIDIEKSVSRSMMQITEPKHQDQARVLRELYTTYEQNKDLISLGAYRQGSDQKIDASIAYREHMMEFVRQPLNRPTDFESDLAALQNFTDAVEAEGGPLADRAVSLNTRLETP